MLRRGLFLALTFATPALRGMVPEPDAVIHGQIFHRFGQALIPQYNEITVIAEVNGTNIATVLLAPGARTFLLRIPMDDGLDPRQPGTAKAGDQIHFFIRNNQTSNQFECVQSSVQPWLLPVGRAPVVAMNLMVEGNVSGTAPDANRNGVPDYWETHFHVTAPRSGQRWSNALFTVQGTASGQLGGVWYQLNGAAWTPVSTANGYTNWSADVMLTPGTNWIRTYATDTTGNCFPTNQTSFFYVLMNQLTVLVSGPGTLLPNYNNKFLELGRSYSMTAVPGAGYVFSNWIGGVSPSMSVLASTAKLNFLMQSNLVLQADFTTNPFLAASGLYTGLFYDTNNVQQANSGFFTLKLSGQGAYSASLRSGSQQYSLSGQFAVDGTLAKAVGPMMVNLALDLADGTRLSGSVSNASSLAELRANRSVFNPLTRPATSYSGNYTMSFPGVDASSLEPEGDGYAFATVGNNGTIKMAGSLADGAVIAQLASVSRDGQWPLYVPLYGGKGSVLGWMTFTNSPDDLTGWLRWIDPPQPKARVYRAGFTNVIPEVAGSRYTPVSSASNPLNLTNGLMIFEGGDLGAAFTNEVTLTGGKVVNTSSNGLTMTMVNSIGLFNGSVTVPGATQSFLFKGTVLTNQNVGAGFFLGTNQSGRVYFAPQ